MTEAREVAENICQCVMFLHIQGVEVEILGKRPLGLFPHHVVIAEMGGGGLVHGRLHAFTLKKQEKTRKYV
jgi:hypothetical protein